MKGDMFIDCNSKTLEQFGYTDKNDFVNHTPLDFSLEHQPDGLNSEQQATVYIENALNGDPQQFYWQHVRANGQLIDIEVSLNRFEIDNQTYLLSIGRDITDKLVADREKQELQDQLLHSHKMESIGTLAGGVAHDFNNILSAILGYSELLLKDESKSEKEQTYLESIYRAGTRARDLVNQILTFSRKDEYEGKTVELQHVIHEALKLLLPAIPTSIEVQVVIQSQCQIWGDSSRIHQIIVNLCTNAYQAMANNRGALNLILSKVQIDELTIDGEVVPPCEYALLTVKDNGAGIPNNQIDRIFEPYFTTKNIGKGTGLGLAVVHGIVKRHRGFITVESEVNIGTTFSLYFPISDLGTSKRHYFYDKLL